MTAGSAEVSTENRGASLAEGMLAGFLFGTAAILIKFLQNVEALQIVFWRLVVACVVLAGISVLLRKSLSLILLKENLRDLVLLSFFLGLHFVFFVLAVKDTTILNATILVNTTPIFSMVVSTLVFKSKPSNFAVLGLVISFTGVFVIAGAETISGGNGSSASLKGDFEAVMAALVESFYLNYGRRIRKQMNVLSTMSFMYFLTAIIVGIAALPVMREMPILPNSWKDILCLVALGVIPTAMAHTLYFSSLSGLRSYETATMALLEPLGATILGVLVFQDVPGLIFVLGAVLVSMGIVFVVKKAD